jgi:serine/threonine protein phosphatase PrpC
MTPYIIVSGCGLIALLILRLAVGSPLPRLVLEIAHAGYIGRRQIYADAFEWSVRSEKTLLVLADGIGAGTKGRAAALAATDVTIRAFDVQNTLNPAYFFKQAYQNAGGVVWEYVPDGTAGANLLCVLVDGSLLYYALAGNCSLSVFRKKTLIQLSKGQTLDVLARSAFRNSEISREDARTAAGERRVYNYVGKDGFRDPEMTDAPVALKRGDYLVMMTDGVYEYCPQLDLENILAARADCRSKAEAVIELLKRKNDSEQDNATIVVARVNRTL